MATWQSLYSLNRRQAHEFLHTCDVYLPVEPTVDPVTKRRGARTYPGTPDYTGVPTRHLSTPDFEEVTVISETTENNIMTQDHFHFHLNQPCGTNAQIQWQGGRYEVQGRGKPSPSLGRTVIDTTMWYAKLGI